MNIEIILTQDNAKLGRRGDVVKVSPGFAYNFLIPQNKARLATPANVKAFEVQKNKQVKRQADELAQAQETARKIDELSLTLEVLAGPATAGKEAEKLYGAVTNLEIQKALAEQGIVVDRKGIHLEEPIRKLGAYQVPVKIHPEASATLRVWVVSAKGGSASGGKKK